jgi:ribosomal protein L29
MSDVMNCQTCGAVCSVLGQDAEGLPQLKAFQNTDAQKKIEQLKKSVHHLQETLCTERATAKAKILNLEAELSNLRKPIGVD